MRNGQEMIYLDSNRWHEAFINLCLVHKISYYIQDEEANYYSHSQTHLITQTDILTDTRLSDVFTIQLFLRNTYSSAFFTLFTKNTLLSDKVSWVVCYDSTSSMRYRGYVKLQLLYVYIMSFTTTQTQKQEVTRRSRWCAGNHRGLMLKWQKTKFRGGHLGFLKGFSQSILPKLGTNI